MNLLKKYLPYISIVVVLFSAYYPVWTGYYLHTDDYFWTRWGHFTPKEVLNFMAGFGRPLSGLLFLPIVYIKSLAGMNIFRFLSVGNLCVAAFLLFHWLCWHKFDRWFSSFLSTAVLTLPPFQVYASDLTAVYGLAATLSILALILVYRGSYVAAFLLLVMAFSLYQPCPSIYLALLAVPLLTQKDLKSFIFWRKIIISLLVFIGAGCVYYLLWVGWLQWAAIPSSGKMDGRNFVTDLGLRWQWFMEGPFVEASNFWNLIPSRVMGHVYSVFLGAVLLFRYIIQNKDNKINVFKTWRLDSLRYFALLFLIPASFCVVLLSSAPSLGYRMYTPLSTILLLLIILPLAFSEKTKYRRLLAGMAFLLMIIGACWANKNVKDYFAAPDSKEIRYLIHSIKFCQEHGKPDFSGVAIVMIHHTLAPAERNEIGEPSTDHLNNIPAIIGIALHEAGIKRDERAFVFTWYPWDPRWYEFGTGEGKDAITAPAMRVYPQKNTIIVVMDRIDKPDVCISTPGGKTTGGVVLDFPLTETQFNLLSGN